MASIDTRLPAPVIGGLAAAGMWLYARGAALVVSDEPLPLALGLALAWASAAIAIAAFLAFWRARTTIDPFRPSRATTLVTRGVYRASRNPMYLSGLLLLLAYAARLESLVALAGPAFYAAWMTRFQILPEEAALEQRFGAAWRAYRARTRRWL
jgi:protein-S-isoprenylcysteine O-methyltransferase Ste14